MRTSNATANWDGSEATATLTVTTLLDSFCFLAVSMAMNVEKKKTNDFPTRNHGSSPDPQGTGSLACGIGRFGRMICGPRDELYMRDNSTGISHYVSWVVPRG